MTSKQSGFDSSQLVTLFSSHLSLFQNQPSPLLHPSKQNKTLEQVYHSLVHVTLVSIAGAERFTVVPGFWSFKTKTLNPIVSVASLATSHKSEKKTTKRFWLLTTRLDVPEIWISCETIFTCSTARLFFKSIYLWKKEKHRQVHIPTSLLYSSTIRHFRSEKKPVTSVFISQRLVEPLPGTELKLSQ